jgi:transcriptional regulator with XRE-family HTH domain
MDATNTGPLIPRRRLGATFRDLRENRGETLQTTARALLFSPSKLSRIENGLGGEPNPRDVRDLIAHFDLDETRQAECESLAEAGRVPGWWQVPPYRMPPRLDTYISYESAASRIEAYVPTVVPGLLQTPDYTSEVLRRLAPSLSEREITAQVDLRQRRRRELDTRSNPPELHFVITETVLRRRVGTAGTMRDQLSGLASLYDDPRVDLHVIPFSSGLYEAAEMSMLTVFYFDQDRDSDVIAMETGPFIYFHDQKAQVREHRRLLADTSKYWLSRAESRDFIEKSARLWKEEGA